jgi:AraC family L-rhamnose operon transcriptional activator RhaR
LEIVNLCLSVDLLDGELSWCVGDRQLGTLWADSSVRCWHLPGSVTAQIDRLGGELIAHQDRNYAAALGLVLQWLGTIAAHLPPAEQGVQPDAMVRQLRVAMRQRLAYDWSLAELAAVVGLEPSYCGRRFRRAVGQSPLQWLARQRCEQAAIALLTTADPVAAIGIGVGWSDPNYFSRIFKKYFSLSPTAYRQQFAQPGLQVRCRDDHWLQW